MMVPFGTRLELQNKKNAKWDVCTHFRRDGGT